MAVMRRDLALCKERSGKAHTSVQDQSQPQASLNGDDDMNPDGVNKSSVEDRTPAVSSEKPDHATEQHRAIEDHAMADSQPDEDSNSNMPIEQIGEDSKSADLFGQSPQGDVKADQTVAQDSDSKCETANATKSGRQADTQPPTDEVKGDNEKLLEDDKAPDTANDLNSLFGGPMSAGAAVGDGSDFLFDQNGSGDIDFGTFDDNFDANNADNDKISSLLPGLEDYANTQPSLTEEVDLDELFNLAGDDQNNGMDQQGAGEQRDSTFADLMDLADFQGSMDGDGNGDNNSANLDFDALFS